MRFSRADSGAREDSQVGGSVLLSAELSDALFEVIFSG